jgi:7-alpha-hydroxysteroid dehydrogenase
MKSKDYNMAEKTLSGKTLFISGGTRGIGKAMVYAYAKKGCDVAFTYASSAEVADEIVADVESTHGVKC